MSQTIWKLDPAHTQIEFKVKHMMVTTVTGTFTNFGAEVTTEGENFMSAQVSFWADTASVTTHNEQRDGHLRSGDFFESEKYPKMTFVATGFRAVDNDGSYEMVGDLTIRDITKNVKLGVEFGGILKNPWGQEIAGFTISGKINRKDWNLNWNAALEAGGLLVSDEVRIHCEVQLIKA
jgi:polyisoprenoid-binding protein YceI